MPQARYTVKLRHPRTLAQIAELDGYQSLSYTRRWQAPGDFRLVLGDEHPLAPLATFRNVVIEVLRDGVFEFAGIVKALEFGVDEGDESAMLWTVTGPDLSGAFHKVLALPDPTQTDSATTAGADYDVQDAVSASAALRYFVDRNRGRARLPLALGGIYNVVPVTAVGDAAGKTANYALTTAASVGSTVTYKARYQPVQQLLGEIAAQGVIGYRFRLDAAVPVVYFDVQGYADRREGAASGHVPAIFSINRDNLRSFKYIDNGLDTENTLYVGGAGSGATRTVAVRPGSTVPRWLNDGAVGWQQILADLRVQKQQAAGGSVEAGRIAAKVLVMEAIDAPTDEPWGRQEAFLDRREETTAAQLDRDIQSYFAEHADLQSVAFQPLESAASRYRLDWDLGDLVSVRCRRPSIRGDAAIHEVAVALTPDDQPDVAITVGRPPRHPFFDPLYQSRIDGHRPRAV